AGFVTEKRCDSGQNITEINAVIENHDDTRAERCADGSRSLKSERRIQFVGTHKRPCGAAQEDRADRTARGDTSRQRDHFAKSRAKWYFIKAGPGDMTGDAKQLRSRRIRRSDARVGLSSFPDDRRNVDQCFYVVDGSRLTK